MMHFIIVFVSIMFICYPFCHSLISLCICVSSAINKQTNTTRPPNGRILELETDLVFLILFLSNLNSVAYVADVSGVVQILLHNLS